MDGFKKHLEEQNLSSTTINNHIRNINKIIKLFGVDFMNEYSDKDLIEFLKNSELNLSQRLTISNTLSKFYKYLDLSNNKIIDYIAVVNNDLKKKYNKRNKNLEYEYTKKDLVNELNKFYDNKEYKKYIVSYLLIYYNVRNADLNIEIVKHKKYSTNEYNNLILRKNSVLYVRTNYKTYDKYGVIKNEIKNKKFINSVVQYFNKETYDDRTPIKLFKNFNNSTNTITKYTPFNLRETDIIKIILKENNSLNQATKISERRGTSLVVLQENYNINK